MRHRYLTSDGLSKARLLTSERHWLRLLSVSGVSVPASIPSRQKLNVSCSLTQQMHVTIVLHVHLLLQSCLDCYRDLQSSVVHVFAMYVPNARRLPCVAPPPFAPVSSKE
jgi:hypothetical protein|mmetsp:Transcript_69360/g.110926  ORF Transcript_69360/g.110926 Transcript_69360/m.110926 type:complete len:110 (-) Transcript_69360:238-567(-)